MLRASKVRPLKVGAGSGGINGDEPPSAVEVVEKAGDWERGGGVRVRVCTRSAKSKAMIGGRGRVGSSRSRGPSSAVAAGGGEEFKDDVFWISASAGGCMLALEAERGAVGR